MFRFDEKRQNIFATNEWFLTFIIRNNGMKKIYTLFLLMVMLAATGYANGNNTGVLFSDGQVKITRFYPNPASSFINFEFQKNLEKGYTLQLYSFIGNKVSEIQLNGSNKITIPLDGFFRGIYLFQLRDKSGKMIESGKFQVVK